MLFAFCSCGENDKKESDGKLDESNSTTETRKSFLQEWGKPSFTTPDDDGGETFTYLVGPDSGEFGESLTGIDIRFKNGKLLSVRPITKFNPKSDSKTGHSDLQNPDSEILFEGKLGLEKYLQQITLPDNTEPLSKKDREKLKQLLIHVYGISQTQGLHQECVIAMKGAFWELMNKNFEEVKKFTVPDEGNEKRIDIKSLVESWQQ